MYDFILNQWVLKKFTTANVQNCITKGYITQDQANVILATAQIS
jgi:hypothetical protein